MSISRSVRFKIFMRDDFTCQYCGVRAPAVELNVDHRVPVSKGGSDDETNLATACVTCNGGKSAHLIPITLTLTEGGPLVGTTIRTTATLPIVWVWADIDGNPVKLMDEFVGPDGAWDVRRVRYGPSFLQRDRKEWERVVEQMRAREDGRHSVLLGAYMPSDTYPFDTFKELTWMEPWQLLLQFDFTESGGG